MENKTDRRKKERFRIDGDALVKIYQSRLFNLLKPKVVEYGPIVDISSSGVSVIYVDREMRPVTPKEMAITLPDSSFRIENIAFTTVSDYKVSETEDRQSVRRRSMRFDKLTTTQASHLSHLLDHYAKNKLDSGKE